MPGEQDAQDNVDRLLRHLEDSSLAANLVQKHRESAAGEAIRSMKAVLAERLKLLREKLDGGET